MLETIFGVVLLMVVAVGSMQASLLLYTRNLVQASAHEAARAASVRGLDDGEARTIADRVVHRSVGSITRNLEVALERKRAGSLMFVSVQVRAVAEPTGPVPVIVPIHSVAEIRTAAEPR